MGKSALTHARRPAPRRLVSVNEVVLTLIVEAILVGVGLAASSSLLPSSVAARTESVIAIRPGRTPTGDALPLTTADLNAITTTIPGTALLSRVVSGAVAVGTTARGAQIRVVGVDPSYALVPRQSLAVGTFFTAQDATAANRVAVLGQTIATTLFVDGQSAVGQMVQIRNQPYMVLGVLASHTAAAENQDNAILIPFQTSQIRLFGAAAIDEALLSVRAANQTDAVTRQIGEVLRQRHRVTAGQTANFAIINTTTAQTGGTVPQTIDRVISFSRQYACVAKALCGS